MKTLLWGLIVLFCNTVYAQEDGIDSTYFWVERVNPQTPTATSLFAENLADNNILDLWYAGYAPPYYGDAYASVHSPQGTILISDQLLLNHPATGGEVVTDQNNGFVLVETEFTLTEVNTTTMHYHRLHPDYQTGQFVEDWSLSDGPLDSLEISLGAGFQPLINGDRLLIVKGISDGHSGQQAPSYYVQVLDLNTGILLRDDPVTYLGDSYSSELAMIAYADGFVLQNSEHTAFLSADGEFVWTTANDFPQARSRLSIRGGNLYSVGIVGSDPYWNDYLQLTVTDLYDGQQVVADTLYHGVHWYGVPVWQDDVLLVATTSGATPSHGLLFALTETGQILDSLVIDDLVMAVDLLDNHLLWYQSSLATQKALWFEFDGFSFVESHQFSLPGYMAANDAARPYSQTKAIVTNSGTYCGATCDYLNNQWVTTAWGLLLDQVSVEQPIARPQEFSLDCYPNPFNVQTNISFMVPEAQWLTFSVYDLLGRQVKSQSPQFFSAGEHRQVFDFAEEASGVYIVALRSKNCFLAQKLTLLK
ncbi:T9SS type A sorting domain-containing protein [Candidatus Nomurabacteria bacterium]|nr:T9SS type A sorting domain-containing protein [Candidatus Nomurabacteria bacterium]